MVITTSTIFAPTPTLASMIIHQFKMRTDTIGYSLAGQGCSSGVVCTELGNQILQACHCWPQTAVPVLGAPAPTCTVQKRTSITACFDCCPSLQVLALFVDSTPHHCPAISTSSTAHVQSPLQCREAQTRWCSLWHMRTSQTPSMRANTART